MHADPKGVLTGVHFLDGDHACCEGTLAAGARFAAGYPITPSTEVVERFAWRIPTVGGIFIQMEDELAASIAIQGAVWGGAKAFTVTSGPGFSLMMEHIGYAAITETPCVFVNVQRGGPSTGLPTLPAQADMMQAKWGSHGDYSIIALCPNSPQECFDLTITGFNLAEEFRVPVMMMLDECVGHMTEKVIIPEADRIEVVHLHAWAARFLRDQGRKFEVASPSELDACWEEAIRVLDERKFDPGFLRQEWEQVIQANEIQTAAEYLKVPRIGRGRTLSRLQRQKVWKVCERYVEALLRRGKAEWGSIIRDARSLL